jgi:DNA-binding IscR family transcriptional regulator
VDALEGPGFAGGCLFGLPRCSDRRPCPLHHTWADVRGRLRGAFARMTLADLGKSREGRKRTSGERPKRQTKQVRR